MTNPRTAAPTAIRRPAPAPPVPYESNRPQTSGRETGLIRRLLTSPVFYLLAPVIASCIVWLVPGSSYRLRGFDVRADANIGAWLLLIVFYALCAGLVWAGSRIGRALGPSQTLVLRTTADRFQRRFSVVLTLFASVGVLYSMYLAQQQTSIIEVLTATQGNDLKETIGGVAGIATLRYTAAISAPVALYVWKYSGGRLSLAVWNIGLLVASALFSSRLSMIMAVVVLIFLVFRLRGEIRFRAVPVVVTAALVFAALTVFNYFRNAQYYLASGVTDPVSMNFYQIAAYLGAPFQVSLGVANGIMNRGFTIASDPISSVLLIVPTFLRPESAGTGQAAARSISEVVQVASSLTTNSAFANVFATYGWWGLGYVLVTMFVAGWLFGYVSHFTSIVVVAGAVIAYSLAEMWRIFLFPQGLVVYLLLAILIATMVGLSGDGSRRASDRARTLIRPTAGSSA